MKNKHFLVFVFSIVVFSANALLSSKSKSQLQDKKTVTVKGIFDGYDADDGYAFLVKDDEDESEEYIYIEAITDEALKMVNLKSANLIGKTFEITYEVSEYDEEDEDGNVETYEKYTIVKVKQL